MRGPAHLFVYGTLRAGSRGGPAKLLSERAVRIGLARVRGALYRVGAYPGLVLGSASDSDRVQGDVFALPDDPSLLAALDRYEGCGPDDPRPHAYERVRADAELDDGRRVSAWTYAWLGRVDPADRIPEWPWPRA
ncbi:MAG TPA: gamma-glutamylcyclotransferase family protein [Candidatus Binatia bacterium]|nr:gamma-glutamylcyclotransferase family protein [Candidatus Binatia bacterium]